MAADGSSERYPATPESAVMQLKPIPGSTWTDQETAHLIDAYEEKWYSSKRGPLRAQQWEEVADEVASRCGFDLPSKSGTQCRHKVEKLRKRYRSERLRPVRSLWPFFDRIDRMERGPFTVSVRPPPPPSASSSDEYDFVEPLGDNLRSITGILREVVPRGNARVSKNDRSRNRLAEEEEVDDDDEEDDEGDEEVEEGSGGRGGNGLAELAAEIRRFGEGYARLGKRRMDMMREMEREWMEMEARRFEMVMEGQKYLVETVAGALLKKPKNSHDL
ncbi:hypothetical protein HPP92_012682 [Vanilla planifolia]|uniref:Myb-like domain-containing protein n=1 Tax=Vanilla planifolia TaxID=51239 RepID=A0A835R0X4_VANPL|nr:hypothetical protein HPP92_012682 [Vanilla planifolia]